MRLHLIEPTSSPFLHRISAAAREAGLDVHCQEPSAPLDASAQEDGALLAVGPTAPDAEEVARRIRLIAPAAPLVVLVAPGAERPGQGRDAPPAQAGTLRYDLVPVADQAELSRRLRRLAQRAARMRSHREAVERMSRQLRGAAARQSRGAGQDSASVEPSTAADPFLSAILAQASSAIVSTDVQGRVLTWNSSAERLFGHAAEQAIGHPLSFLDPPAPPAADDVSTLGTLVRQVLASHAPEESDAVCQRRDGSLVEVAASVGPLRDPAGNVIGLTALARDVSERRRVEAALREANRQKDEFLATVSHEIRTPLTAIVGFTDMLLRGLDRPLPPRTSRYVANIRAAGDRLLALMNALLDYTRLEARGVVVCAVPVDLVDTVRRAVEAIRPAARAKNLRLEVRVREPVGAVLADAEKLGTILGNYLSNAVKFTPAGGEVVVHVDRDPDVPGMGRVAVRDTGIGIAADQLERIWQRFYQVDASLTREHGGIGLGLAIVRHLVALHGGRSGAESPGLGTGSTFWFSLPLVAPAAGG